MNVPVLLFFLSAAALGSMCVNAVPVDKLRSKFTSTPPAVFQHIDSSKADGKSPIASKSAGGTALEHEEEVVSADARSSYGAPKRALLTVGRDATTSEA